MQTRTTAQMPLRGNLPSPQPASANTNTPCNASQHLQLTSYVPGIMLGATTDKTPPPPTAAGHVLNTSTVFRVFGFIYLK